ALQRHQLDADDGAHHRLSLAVAGRARTGHGVRGHSQCLARLPVLGGHPPGRLDRGAHRGDRGGQDRRSGPGAPVRLRGGADRTAHPVRRPALLDRVLVHRFLRGLALDPGRALQHDPRLRHLRLQRRDQCRRYRDGGLDHLVHVPPAGRVRDRHAAAAAKGVTLTGNLWRTIKRDYGPYLPLSPYLFIVLFPFYWMIITTFKRDNDLYNLTGVPFWFKEPPTMAHVQLLLRDTLFIVWLKNSLLIGACVVVITLALGLPAAYALARMRFRGNQAMSTAMF